MVTLENYEYSRLISNFINSKPSTELTYHYGITKKLASAPVDRLLKQLLQKPTVDQRVIAADKIGQLGFQQLEIVILGHVAKHDVSLAVRAAAQNALLSISARLQL